MLCRIGFAEGEVDNKIKHYGNVKMNKHPQKTFFRNLLYIGSALFLYGLRNSVTRIKQEGDNNSLKHVALKGSVVSVNIALELYIGADMTEKNKKGEKTVDCKGLFL